MNNLHLLLNEDRLGSLYSVSAAVAVTIVSFVHLFILCGHGSSLLWTPALRPLCRSNAPAQGQEGNCRCVQCMCALCGVEEGTVGVSSLSGISKHAPSRRGLVSG